MEYPQVSGYSDGQEWAPCKTVGICSPPRDWMARGTSPALSVGNRPAMFHVMSSWAGLTVNELKH